MYVDERQIYKQGYGICVDSPQMIVNSFYSVRNTYRKVNPVKVHYMEVFIEYEMGGIAVPMISDTIAKYLYDNGFQSFVSAIDTGNSYMIAIAVNAVAYKHGKLFKDNNDHYQEIFQYLCQVIPVGWQLGVTENTFFDPQKMEGNYVHGVYV